MSSGEKTDSQGRYWRIDSWFPSISIDVREQLRAFHAELVHFNGKMNLISPRTEKVADSVHFADGILGSISIAKHTKIDEIYDIGSGNGIPGIIYAALYPNTRVVLIDVDARKIEFMKHCIARMSLKNCTAEQSRFEDLSEGSIRFAMSRGFAAISKVLIASRKVVAPECCYFHFKGPSWSTEVATIPAQVLSFWEVSHVADYRLPDGDATMTVVLTKLRIK